MCYRKVCYVVSYEPYIFLPIWVTWPRWLPRPYMVKNNSFFLQNRWADCNEIWYVVSRMLTHHSLNKFWPWVDIDLFYVKVKFGRSSIYMGKMKLICFSKTIAAYDLKVCTCIALYDQINLHEYQRSREFFDLCQMSLFSNLNIFSQKLLRYLKPNTM